ncbi:MAG TPA: amidase family protein, partial [Anaerolineae bacterium]|nr:amidase family protein [Anaerolineae bacterium]
MKKSIFIITLLLLALTTGIALAQTPEGKEYTVQPGDSLSAIAKKEYGNPQAFPAIVAATNAKAAEDDSFAVIKEARTILVGQKLWLPVQPIPETTVNNEVITMTTPTAWPNLADYPHLVQAQLSNQPSAQEMLAEAGAACPEINTGRQYPLAEPDYTGKRARDLSAFETALADFTPERAAALDALLTGKTIPELQSLLDSGDLTSAELVTYYVDRIRRYDLDKLNSVMELNPEALDIARKLDAERAAGTLRGPMHGIPVLLKDNIATGDRTHTTAGAAALQDWVADRDAFLVQQIRAAGGLILGKANLSEWANFMDPCMPSGFSVVGGQTRHPYGPFDPRGSSSGSAVSVAANLTTVSVGSETSGSLIQPARVNGAVALRPSQGLISRDYVVPLGPDLDTPGPMGRSLTDVAILLNAMTGVDPRDPKTGDAAALAGTDFTRFLNLDRARG